MEVFDVAVVGGGGSDSGSGVGDGGLGGSLSIAEPGLPFQSAGETGSSK